MFDLDNNGQLAAFERALEFQFIDEVLMDDENNRDEDDDWYD